MFPELIGTWKRC